MKTKEKNITPLSSYKEDLIYMAYRYAIGRHTIQSNMIAKDIIRHEYYRMLLNPERMVFMSKDINRSIEEVLRWHTPSLYIDNYNQANAFPYELYNIVMMKDEESGNVFKPSTIKSINVSVDEDGNYVSHTIKYKNESEITNDSSYIDNYDMTISDLEIWHMVAKALDIDHYKTVTLNDGTTCEYFDTIVNKKWYKIPVKNFVEHPCIFTYIPDEAIAK